VIRLISVIISCILSILIPIVLWLTHHISKERFLHFLPSALIILVIGIVAFYFHKIINKRIDLEHKNIKWIIENRYKYLLKSFIALVLRAPALEELIFRAVLIIAFPILSAQVYYWILVSSIAFAALHIITYQVALQDVLAKGSIKSYEAEITRADIKRIYKDRHKEIGKRTIFNICYAFLVGIIAAYYGIKYQSIWICVGIHASANLILLIASSFVRSVFFRKWEDAI